MEEKKLIFLAQKIREKAIDISDTKISNKEREKQNIFFWIIQILIDLTFHADVFKDEKGYTYKLIVKNVSLKNSNYVTLVCGRHQYETDKINLDEVQEIFGETAGIFNSIDGFKAIYFPIKFPELHVSMYA